MKLHPVLILMMICLLAAPAAAQEYSAVATDEAAPTEEFSDEVRELIGDAGIKVLKGKRTYLEIWPTKQWNVTAGFEPTLEVLYPFQPGDLVGVVRLKSKLTDFRGQEIGAGLYTLRYGQQPVDGNHVGTAPTRDFFLLLPAGDDESAAPLSKEQLFELSMDAAESAHPAILYLQGAPQDAGDIELTHLEDQEWWVLTFVGDAKAGDETKKLPVSLIVVGRGQE